MQHHPRQFASDGAIDVFDDGKICWEEDVEVALLDLWRAYISGMSEARKDTLIETYEWRANRYSPPLISRLHNRRVESFCSVRQSVEITSQ